MDSRLSARALATQLGGWRTREPAYEALADGIRVLCLDGRIAPRTALPAERELAVALHVSRTTIATAYRSLRDSGHIESVRGSGSVTLPAARSGGAAALGAREGDLDLQQASPPAWPGLGGVVSEVLESATSLLGRRGYDIVGSAGLRRAIADRYTRSGVTTSPDEIMVTAGAQSGIHLLASLLISRGDRAVIETPTYPHAAEALRRAGARLVPVPVSAESGWDIDRATQAFARTLPTVAYLMPDFQNPTGSSMNAEERDAIIGAAARSGTVLLVDETTADLDIDRRSPRALFGAGEPGVELVRIGSLGKTVWGGLRVGWIRADASLIRRLAALRSAHDLGTPELEQAVAQRLVESLDLILPQRSDLLREGRDTAIAALSKRLPSWDVPRPGGGVALWIGLDAPLSTSLVLDARASGLLLSAGPLFGIDGGHDARLRVPYTLPPADLERAVAILADSWERVRDGAPADLVGRLESVV
jgi:DNA-binding transcriptional MocR family regulator